MLFLSTSCHNRHHHHDGLDDGTWAGNELVTNQSALGPAGDQPSKTNKLCKLPSFDMHSFEIQTTAPLSKNRLYWRGCNWCMELHMAGESPTDAKV